MTQKSKAIILLTLTILSILALAGSLSELQLQRGQPFTLATQPPSGMLEDSFTPASGDFFMILLRGAMAMALVLLPLLLVAALFSPEGRRRLLKNLVAVALLLLLIKNADSLSALENVSPTLPGESAGEMLDPYIAPVQVFDSTAPAWLTPVITFSLAAIMALAAAALLYTRSKPDLPSANALEQLASQAEKALEALRSGLEVSDTIIACYMGMSQVLKEDAGIWRGESMTPREFEQLLSVKGLPKTPVRRLTRLFEDVRYGDLPTGERDEQLALLSLSEIVDYCRRDLSDVG
jgi:hypothetical protein